MYYIIYKLTKGFTIIELLLVLGLLSIVLVLLFSFFTSFSNMFYKADNDIELMQQCQFILGFMEEKMIDSCEIIYLEDIDGKIKLDTSDNVVLKKIIVKNNDRNENSGYIFQLNKDDSSNTYNLKYGIGLNGSATVEAGNYIEKIEIEPIPSNKTFRESNGIIINLTLKVNDQIKSMRSQLYFRNSHRR